MDPAASLVARPELITQGHQLFEALQSGRISPFEAVDKWHELLTQPYAPQALRAFFDAFFLNRSIRGPNVNREPNFSALLAAFLRTVAGNERVDAAKEALRRGDKNAAAELWPAIHVLGLLGQFDMMANLIPENQRHPDVTELLKNAPVLDPRALLKDHVHRLRNWQADLERVIQLDGDQIDSNLVDVLRVLSGSDDGRQWLASSADVSVWARLCAYVLYYDPSITRLDIVHVLQEELHVNLEQLNTFDHVITSTMVFEHDTMALLKDAMSKALLEYRTNGNDNSIGTWLWVHWIDLAWHLARSNLLLTDGESGRLSEAQKQELSTLREHVILDTFVKDLCLDSQSFWSQYWNVALDYTSYCHERGVFMLQDLLPRVQHIDSEFKLRKVLESIDRYHARMQQMYQIQDASAQPLQQVRRQIVVNYALEHCHKQLKQTPMAIKLLIECGDQQHVGHIIDEILDRYLSSPQHLLRSGSGVNQQSADALVELRAVAELLKQGSVLAAGTAQNADPKALEMILFVCKYVELIDLMAAKEWEKASRLIVQMLASSAAAFPPVEEQFFAARYSDGNQSVSPRRMWLLLLMHAVSMLENSQRVIFDAQETYKLMSCLEQVSLSHRSSEYWSGLVSDDNTERIIRLALTRNLSRALVAPARTSVSSPAAQQEQQLQQQGLGFGSFMFR